VRKCVTSVRIELHVLTIIRNPRCALKNALFQLRVRSVASHFLVDPVQIVSGASVDARGETGAAPRDHTDDIEASAGVFHDQRAARITLKLKQQVIPVSIVLMVHPLGKSRVRVRQGLVQRKSYRR
jgi:hypothetical protein